MLSIFKRKRQFQNLEWMQIDMHNHILPGLDDGAQNLEESLYIIEELFILGVRQFYSTPHIMQDLYPNTPSKISKAYNKLKSSSYGELLPGYAAEYMVDGWFDAHMQQDYPLLTLPGRHVLIEMPYMQKSQLIEKSIFDLQVLGYKPILAHPERYLFYHGRLDALEHLREIGCLFQLNLLSLYGYYGMKEKEAALALCGKGWVDFVGSDVHHKRHVDALKRFVEKKDLWPSFRKCSLQNNAFYSSG